MSIPQVGQGSVAVVPTFRGFRKATDAVFGTAAKAGSSIFNTGFRNAGTTSGKGFASAFASATKGVTSTTLKQAQADVSKASREVSALRLREADATGRVRVAEAALAEARRKYSADSSQVIRAEERLATVQRASITSKSNLLGATQRLTAAQRELAAATNQASSAGGRSGGVFANLSNTFGSAGRNGASRFSQGFRDVLGGVLGANILTGIGYTIGREIGDAARAGIGYAFESVQLASGLEQSIGSVTAQFGDQADAIFAASKKAATSVGLSRSTYQSYSTVVGALLKNLGVRQSEISGKTIDLIELGSDLSAQYGGPVSSAVEALSSLLRGERDPIEKYGVSLKQADINARLAAMGMSDLTGEAEKQATIQATLELLWEQTSAAQGTFFRERNTYAGQEQRLLAQLQDAQTEFGNTLLPTAIDVLSFATDDLLPILKDTLEEAGPALNASLRKALPEIEATLKALGENLPELIDLGGEISTQIVASIEGDFGEGGIIGGIPRVKSELEGFGEWLTRDFATYENWDDYWATFGSGFEHWWDVAWDGVDDAAHARAERLPGQYAAAFQTADAMDRATSAGTATGSAISEAALTALQADKEGMALAGASFADGVAVGIESGKVRVGNASRVLAGVALKEFKGALQSNSPSRLTREIGDEGFAGGFASGILDGAKASADAAKALAASSVSALSVASAVTGGLSGSASRVGATIDGRQYVTVSPEQDPRIVGRQYGREFLREIAGDAP